MFNDERVVWRLCLIVFVPTGSHCEDHEDAQVTEAPAVVDRGPQPALLTVQAQGTRYKGEQF